MKQLLLILLVSMSLMATERNIPKGSVLFFDCGLFNYKTHEGYTFDTQGKVIGRHLCDANEVLVPYLMLFEKTKKQYEKINQKIELYETIRQEVEQAFKDKLINAQDRQIKIQQVNQKIGELNCAKNDLFNEHHRISQELIPEIMKIVKEIAIKSKAAAVSDKKLVYLLHSQYDITQEVIDRINEKYGNFNYQPSCCNSQCRSECNSDCNTTGYHIPKGVFDLSF